MSVLHNHRVNISVYTLCGISKWKFPFSAWPSDLPRVLAWCIYSTCMWTLIKVQIHMTPEHIKAGSCSGPHTSTAA